MELATNKHMSNRICLVGLMNESCEGIVKELTHQFNNILAKNGIDKEFVIDNTYNKITNPNKSIIEIKLEKARE